jgi:hypothetical protein
LLFDSSEPLEIGVPTAEDGVSILVVVVVEFSMHFFECAVEVDCLLGLLAVLSTVLSTVLSGDCPAYAKCGYHEYCGACYNVHLG